MSEVQNYPAKFNLFLVFLFFSCYLFLFIAGSVVNNSYITLSGFILLAFQICCILRLPRVK
jgi:hypothetical protein